MIKRVVVSNYDEYGNPATAVSVNAFTGYVLTTTSSAITSTTTSADIIVGSYKELAFDTQITAVSGTTPTYQITVNRKGADGVYYQIYQSASITATGSTSVTLGVGASTNVGFGDVIQIVETIGGTTPSFTRSQSIKGK